MHKSSLHTGKSHPTNRERQERERERVKKKILKSQNNVKGFLGRSKGGEKAAAPKERASDTERKGLRKKPEEKRYRTAQVVRH